MQSSWYSMASLRLPEDFDLEASLGAGGQTTHSTPSFMLPSVIMQQLDVAGSLLLNNTALRLAGELTSGVWSDKNNNVGGAASKSQEMFLNNSSGETDNNLSVEQVPDRFYRHSVAMSAVYCVAYVLVFIVGLIGNSFVIAVVVRSPRMRTVTNFFIVNLAIADVLVIVFCLPATLMSNIFVREY